ncbi:beta-lactamase-like protein [Mycena floridula]|nr:beta-lactamase-like protein [Mycena floridula]
MARSKKTASDSRKLESFFAAGSKTPGTGKRSSSKPLPQDIIIITDSDSESESQSKLLPAKHKRRRPSESSEVEIVEKKRNCLAQNSKAPAASSSIGQGRNGSTTIQAPRPFGEPILTATMDLGGDEWSTGDDETAFAAKDQAGDDDIEILEDVCPICCKLITLNLQEHVNECLDESASTVNSSSTPSSSKTPKPLRPLSSLQPPSNAFSVLMSSNKENEAWKEAEKAEASRPGRSTRRAAPFYKVMEGFPIAVDAFKYGKIPGITAYFLTHAHSDHYTNLSSSWQNGPIYCSEATANLIIHMLKVDQQWVHPLPFDETRIIPNTNGCQVTLIPANHCPGSSLFFFEGKQTVNAGDSTYKSARIGSPNVFRYLHCGDFRASPEHVLHPAVKGKRIDLVYLDTTYLDPKYTFPPQPLVISACAELARRLASGESLHTGGADISSWVTFDVKGKQKATPDNFLMVVGTYSIGKERIVKAIAKALNSKVYCDARKTAILRCQGDSELDTLLTSKPLEANVHIVPLGLITSDKLKEYGERFKGHFSNVVGFRPTGWTYTQTAGTNQTPTVTNIIARGQGPKSEYTYSNFALYPIPYSEHSSFFELTCFAMSLDYGKMIATVNVESAKSRGKMGKWFQLWDAERKKREKGSVVDHRQLDFW